VKNLDLIDWTIQEAAHLKPEQRELHEVQGTTPLDKLFAVLGRGPAGRPSSDHPVPQISATLTATETLPPKPSSDAVRLPPNSAGLTVSPPPGSAISANGWVQEQMPELLKAMSNLHKAIVEPDIFTARADRDRAIALRWTLRDIKNKRLKWFPLNEQDLRILIIMGLVEMQDDAPLLTKAGLSAIV
jgi:hypothetical protein